MIDEFSEVFINYSIIEKLAEEDNFGLRCCLALFQSYIEYLKKPNEKIKTLWNLKIKPDLLKKYPMQKNGIFNVNADVEFLIKEIDKMNITQNENNESESEKSYIKSKLRNIRMNTICISSKYNIRNSNKYKKHRRIPSDIPIKINSSNKNNENENVTKMNSSNITPIKLNFQNNHLSLNFMFLKLELNLL